MEFDFEHDKDLSSLTTFHIPARAALYAEYSSVKELTRISRTEEFNTRPVLHIGGGSNLLFTEDFDGLVLHSAIKGMVRYDKDSDTVFAIVGAGEKWTDFVDWCVGQGLGGLENLAGIPGEAGAAPVQNVGAYGAEAGDFIYSVECFDTRSREVVTLKAEECGFGYRDSRFKHEWKGRYIVLRVSFRLIPSDMASNLEYGPLASFAEKLGRRPSIREVADEVVRIRAGKLPDPDLIGSAGSFFKNPVVSRYYYEEEVLARDSSVPCFELSDGRVKIPAAWLIDHAGLKGHRVGGAEVFRSQPLVIANTGNASASDVMRLCDEICAEVNRKYAVRLHPEVNFISSSIKVRVLGSGTSKGIPEIGCLCHVCTSDDSRDRRMRASVLVQVSGLNILIDASPDFRRQAIDAGIDSLDAVLLTHSHYDHVGGIDDLRPLCFDGDMKIYARKDVDADLRRRIDYCFREHPYPGVPTFDMHDVENRPFYIDGVRITPVEVFHGKLPIFGYRIGDFAYITDAKTIPEHEMDKLYGLKVLVLNGLRHKSHFAHLSIEEALEVISVLKPERAYLTHFSHEAGTHEEMLAMLPDNVSPAFDGLVIDVK